ncbi:MAG: hypothetical protein R2824_25205 [Saprospiraceae bacterium]
MNFLIYLRKWLGLDVFENFLWINAPTMSNLATDTYIEGTQIIIGENSCDLILRPNANVEIAGIFKGKIIGLGNNVVRIRGALDGILSCDKMILFQGGGLKGNAYISKLVVQQGAVMDSEVSFMELVPFIHAVERIDFDFIKKL